MQKRVRIFSFLLLTAGLQAQGPAGDLVRVEGGTFTSSRSNYFGKPIRISAFYIGKHEITQKEWTDLMGSNPSKYKGDNLPVETVSWYECVEYCNKRSIKEGLSPHYKIYQAPKDLNNESDIDNIKWTVSVEAGANGYRLPTEAEWEYAASGGQQSKGFTYSGSNEIDEVGWYFKNSGDAELTGFWNWPMIDKNHNRTKPVGSKKTNELGLYDMSGNVREWCWDWYREWGSDGPDLNANPRGSARVWRGGGWLGADFCCAIAFRGGFEASGRGPDQGFRVCRTK